MHQRAKLKGLGVVLLLLLGLTLSFPVLADQYSKTYDGGDAFADSDSFLPAFSQIFWNEQGNGVFQSTNHFTAFFLLFFVVLFGVETTFGPYYSENRWINIGLSFFISAYAWSRFASTLVKIAKFFDWFAIVGIIFLIVASAQRIHGEGTPPIGSGGD